MTSRINRANLDRELARRGWTANDLAVASGVSAATISSARHGRPMKNTRQCEFALEVTLSSRRVNYKPTIPRC